MHTTWSHQRYIKLHAAHQKHPIVRVVPNYLSCGRADAIKDVLGHGVFLRKSDSHAVQAGSHRNIVDEQDRGEHSRKRKVLAAAFSAKAVAACEPVVAGKVGTVIKNSKDSARHH
jgi:cytochrome P450